MDKQILPEQPDHTAQIALKAITASRAGLTLKGVQDATGGRSNIRQAILRAALDQLVDKEVLEYEKPSKGPGIYFLPHQKPSPCLKVVPAEDFAPIRPMKSSWLSMLGMAA